MQRLLSAPTRDPSTSLMSVSMRHRATLRRLNIGIGGLRIIAVEADLHYQVGVVSLLHQAVVGEPGGEVRRSHAREDRAVPALARLIRYQARPDRDPPRSEE